MLNLKGEIVEIDVSPVDLGDIPHFQTNPIWDSAPCCPRCNGYTRQVEKHATTGGWDNVAALWIFVVPQDSGEAA